MANKDTLYLETLLALREELEKHNEMTKWMLALFIGTSLGLFLLAIFLVIYL